MPVQLFPAATGEDHCRVDIQPLEGPTPDQVDVPWRKLQPVEDLIHEQAPGRREAHAGASFLVGTMACGGTTLEQLVPDGLYPVERTHAGSVLEELQSVKRTHVRSVHEGMYPVEETPCWSMETV
ncbi:hypothetical protein llap_8286 [Limosa lapponica baueri]|uniref:Uncharacterized protein n=1 Tax=Limosa lapponica baueri TaxID=1758121 RepID=A0A2I0U5Y3_LIMLA|nr:hypothetical protein llap_8286 [Limosa lapponica baueri]